MLKQGNGWPWYVLSILCALAMGVCSNAVAFAAEGDSDRSSPAFLQALAFDNPSWSPTGDWLAFSDGPKNLIYLQNMADNTLLEIVDAPSSGYAFNWSSDGEWLGFKLLIPTGQDTMPLQMPMVFHVATQELIPLCPATARAGVPSFAADGRIAFTVDQELRIVNSSGDTLQTYPLGNYANLAPISPDGTKVAFNGTDEQIWILDLASGKQKAVTNQEESYHTPVWSPDSSKVIVHTIFGHLHIIDVENRQLHDLGEGCSPSWAPDSTTILFCKLERIEGMGIRSADLWQSNDDGTAQAKLTDGSGVQPVAARISVDGGKIALVSVNEGLLYQASLAQPEMDAESGKATQGSGYRLGAASEIGVDGAFAQKVESAKAIVSAQNATPTEPITTAQIVVSGSVPYIHQVYDTPDDFCGGWACNATAAMMAIGYYQILPHWDVTCSTPYSHVSHYGRYISQVYSHNGYTYNIGSADACGDAGYGGYGYIVRNDWADTRGYMRDYFIQHGLGSSVDWSPTFSKLRSEIDAQHPFVFLVNITSSGHYITAIGYFDNQYTVIFNDPYGNKNSGYMNYSGTRVCYDWPGYNNGYANLVGVVCYIYARGTTYTNPPYLFGSGAEGWTAGNSASGITHTGSDWGGSIYFDQTGNDCWIYSPTTNISGPYAPQVLNVDFYPQGGTTAAHDMQLFWKTNASNAFSA
ncbi:MAG: hypothetical protein GXY55_03310, partial [Phycisphaerae bacterium]|nr:hypothetical protein [Phycisphaerae bacterium]